MGFFRTSITAAMVMIIVTAATAAHDYGDALSKCILFFEGQRSGKLPSNQRMTWRGDSGLRDGFEIGMIIPSNVTDTTSFIQYADRFVCTVLPESPTVSVQYSPGGLLFKPGGSNMQHVTALSFLLITYGRRLQRYKQVVHCGNVVINHDRLYNFARSQVDYLLGTNPLKMSYMVGYGSKFPQKIHHRASSLPSIAKHRERIDCQGGTSYFASSNPNPNQLTGAVVGGPDIRDNYFDSRDAFVHSEPTTYINAPLVGVLGYFKSHP
ncbi:Endoglucanase 23 [Linum perenne]